MFHLLLCVCFRIIIQMPNLPRENFSLPDAFGLLTIYEIEIEQHEPKDRNNRQKKINRL